jgi:two-component system OmpR family response regulator
MDHHPDCRCARRRGEFSLLREFLQRPGRVLSRDHLLLALSGREAEAYDRSIDMLVVRLRRKIEPDPKQPKLISTVQGAGYKFTAIVRKTALVQFGDLSTIPSSGELKAVRWLSS